MKDPEVFERAVRFALDAHHGMRRRQSSAPYILHPLEAAVIVGTLSDDPELLAAAVLHDTVEDTDVEPEDILIRFGPRVAELVASETEKVFPGMSAEESWALRKEASLKVLEAGGPDVKKLWLGDKLSNMRSFFRVYLLKGGALWQGFHQKDPEMQYRYYGRIRTLTMELQNTAAWQEYDRLFKILFADRIRAEEGPEKSDPA